MKDRKKHTHHLWNVKYKASPIESCYSACYF